MALYFDTLKYSQYYEDGGFTRDQAECLIKANETQAESLANTIKNELATKLDINEVKADINELRLAIKLDINEVKTDINELKIENKALNGKLNFIITIISILSGFSALFSGLSALLHYFGK